MHKLHQHKVGLALGSFFGLAHILWALMVKLGLAESYFRFVFGLHFLSMPLTFLSFSWVSALELIVVASIAGYIIGTVLSYLWNKFVV